MTSSSSALGDKISTYRSPVGPVISTRSGIVSSSQLLRTHPRLGPWDRTRSGTSHCRWPRRPAEPAAKQRGGGQRMAAQRGRRGTGGEALIAWKAAVVRLFNL